MNFKKKSKFLLLLIFIILSSFILTNVQFGTDIQVQNEANTAEQESLVIPEQADEPIPKDPYIDPFNNWHWNVSKGDKLIFEMEVTSKNLTSLEIMPVKMLAILNITSFENITEPSFGFGQTMSQVNASFLYYDYLSQQLEIAPFTSPSQIALFGYNSTNPVYPERYRGPEDGLIHALLPINDTTVDVTVMDDILYNTYISQMGIMGLINHFDKYDVVPSENKIYFTNTTDGYYWNMTFYNNGTLKSSKGEILVAEDGGPLDMEVEFEIERVFDYNMTDEVEWGFDVGDSLYFGTTNEDDDAMEAKFDIVAINTTDMGSDMFWMAGGVQNFQFVLANASLWNFPDQKWDQVAENYLLTAANNYYPLLIENYGSSFQFVCAKNTELEDWLFFFNNETISMFGLDDVYYTIDGDDFTLEMTMAGEDFEVKSVIDNSTGIFKIYYIDFGGWKPLMTFSKNMSVVNFPNDISDFWLYSSLVPEWNIYMNATINVTHSKDYEVIWAVLPVNPTNVPFARELPEEVCVYIDVYVNDTQALVSANMTIHYDEAALAANGVDENKLIPYMLNTYDGSWDAAPSAMYEIDTDNDVIRIYFGDPSQGQPGQGIFTIGLKSAPAAAPSGDDDDDGGGEEAPIPGYNLYILLLLLSLVSIVIILKRRKRIRF
ncbi:MAG: hypothetical protein ACFFHV_17660 [Promethearchaeota archaeon]